MENLFNKFFEVMKEFEKNSVDYILIGGIAMNLQGFSRNTEDIDIFVNPIEENIIKMTKSLMEVFHDEDINEITFEELTKYPVIRYVSQHGICIDIIVRIGERFSFEDLEYDIKEIEEVKIKYANSNTLYRLKEKTYREIDKLDLKYLKLKLNK